MDLINGPRRKPYTFYNVTALHATGFRGVNSYV